MLKRPDYSGAHWPPPPPSTPEFDKIMHCLVDFYRIYKPSGFLEPSLCSGFYMYSSSYIRRISVQL